MRDADQVARLRQRRYVFGDDSFIENEQGEQVVQVDGKPLGLGDTLVCEDTEGRELYRTTARLVDIRRTIDVRRPDGSTAVVAHSGWFSPLHDRRRINVLGGEDLIAVGDLLQHEHTFRRGEHLAAAIVSRRWLPLHDSYGVEVEDSSDAPLIQAIAGAMDLMSHGGGQDIS